MGHDEEHEQRGLSAGLGSVAGVACLINHIYCFQMPGRFKPRCRFDRVYLRDSHPKRVTEEHFGLFGLEKIRQGQRFPSDHWGILVAFTLKSS